MKAKDLAQVLAVSTFVPSPSDHLGAKGQRAINLFEALKGLDVDIVLKPNMAPVDIADAIEQAVSSLSIKNDSIRRDIADGLIELRQYQGMGILQPA